LKLSEGSDNAGMYELISSNMATGFCFQMFMC
jgi:hypothetical protein